MSEKKSEFIAIETVPDDYSFNVFGNSVDRKISKTNLFAQIKDESFSPFIYPTIELLQNADLEADEDSPTWVRCKETEYRLYQITNLAVGVDDIALDNGNTATYQLEYRDVGFVIGPDVSVAGSLAIFTDTGGAQLDDLLVPTESGKAFMQAADSASVTFPRKNADNTVSMLGASTYFDAIKQVSAVGYAGAIKTADNTAALAQAATDMALTPANLAALKASNADVITGTDNIKYVTSSTLQHKLEEETTYVVENVAALASTPVVAGRTYYLKEYHSGTGYGGSELEAYTSADTPNNGTIFASGTVGVRLKRINTPILTVDHFGAKKDGTDSTAAIQAFIDAHPNGADVNFDFGVYTHFSTIYLKYQGIFLKGRGVFATDLKYVNVAGGTAIKANSTTAIINGAGISGINFTADAAGTAPDITIDLSGFSYSVFEDFEIYNPRVNGVLIKGYSDLGTAPYYNSIDKFRLFGGSDYTQTGILFSNGAWGGGSRGPNANMITNLMRGASLLRLIDLKEGQGNLFSNISGESINDHMIILNDIASYVDTGTATSGANSSLTDSGKSWTVNEFVNYSVTITGGAGVGQTRKITSNTATVLSVSPAWGVKLNGTSTYAISRLGAFENQFINLRQEGLNTLNPNFVTCLPGSLGNNISNYSVSSLGSGKTINDVSGHPSNHLSNGKYMFITEVIENPGASANINIWTKTSVLGGLGAGDSYNVEWMQVKCPGIVSGTATFTLDVGGVAVGGGSPTLTATLDSVLVNDAFVTSTDKEVKSSLNNGLFLNITTDASMNASTDFVVTVCVAVH